MVKTWFFSSLTYLSLTHILGLWVKSDVCENFTFVGEEIILFARMTQKKHQWPQKIASVTQKIAPVLGGGDKVLISKFSILTTGELFIGYIQTMFGFWTFRFGAKNPLRSPSEDFDPPRPPPRASKYPKMGVGSIVWGIFLHVYFLYNFWEFLQFFPEL